MARAKCTHNLVAAVGEYDDGQGNKKKRWQRCGFAFTNDEGAITIKFEALPVSDEWDNYLNLFPRDEGEQPPPDGNSRCSHDLMATIGEYRDDNNTKQKRKIRIGVGFTRGNGTMSIKLDAVPLVAEWSRFASLEPKADRVESKPSSRPEMADDDIPF